MKSFLLALVCAAGMLRAQTSETSTYVIAGTVVNALSKTPIPKALVRINPAQAIPDARASAARLAITSDDGRFAFLNVPAGKYQLSAARPNDRAQMFLGHGSQFSTAVVTGPNFDTAHLVFPYHAAGALDGSVIDENGEPVRNAQIYAFRHDTIDGRLQYVRAGQAVSHGAGLFHFGHLVGGSYLVAVSARPWFANGAQRVEKASELDVAYPFTYYPGTAELSAATPITINEGNTSKIQIPLRAVPAIHLSLNLPATSSDPAKAGPGQPQQFIQITTVGPDNIPITTHGVFPRQDISEGIAPGRYRLLQRGTRNGEYSTNSSKIVDLTTDTPLEFDTMGHAAVSGTVSIEGSEKITNPVVVMLAPVSGGPPLRAQAGKDLHFEFSGGLAPGRYRVFLPANRAFFLKSITAKGANVSGGQVDLQPNATVQLSLVMTPSSDLKLPLQGVALRSGKPQAGAMVLLLPANHATTDLIRRDQSDLDGSFNLSEIPPGDYRLLAIDNGHGLAYRDPKVIAPYLAKAQSIKIGATTPPPTDLKVEIQTR